jgi:hypothetical protein
MERGRSVLETEGAAEAGAVTRQLLPVDATRPLGISGRPRCASGITRANVYAMQLRFLAALTVPALAVTACANLAPTYAVKLSARSTRDAARPVSFAILTDSSATAADAKLAARAAGIVRSALRDAGMNAERAERADLIVALEYSVDSTGSVREWVSTPIWRSVPGPSITRTVFVGTTSDGKPIYSTTVEPGEPTMVYQGERQGCAVRTMYEKRLRLSGRRNAGPGYAATERWSVEVTTTDQGNDLRKYIPALASAATRYINQNSGGAVTMQVRSDGRPLEGVAPQGPRVAGC